MLSQTQGLDFLGLRGSVQATPVSTAETKMALFLIERNIGELLQISPQAIGQIEQAHVGRGVEWLYSFLRAHHKSNYCLYEVSEPQALIDYAHTQGIPEGLIVEISRDSSNTPENHHF